MVSSPNQMRVPPAGLAPDASVKVIAGPAGWACDVSSRRFTAGPTERLPDRRPGTAAGARLWNPRDAALRAAIRGPRWRAVAQPEQPRDLGLPLVPRSGERGRSSQRHGIRPTVDARTTRCGHCGRPITGHRQRAERSLHPHPVAVHRQRPSLGTKATAPGVLQRGHTRSGFGGDLRFPRGAGGIMIGHDDRGNWLSLST